LFINYVIRHRRRRCW